MNRTQTLTKLRKAHIPPAAYQTTFEREGMTAVSTRVTCPSVLTAPNLINFYLYDSSNDRGAARRAHLATGLTAKVLCLSGMAVVYSNLAGFLRDQRMAEMEREQNRVNPVINTIGTGYIAIGDFLEFDDVEQRYGYPTVRLAADYLIEHVGQGGGLILGGTVEPRDATQYGAAFTALIDMFESYRV